MITNDGKEVLSKYLLGQAPAYATHIAIGCGAEPLENGDPTPDFSQKQTLDFEMLRVPISSRGFVEEGGVTKISLGAELPTENRYEISEVGLWSAASNTLARGFDSRIIFDFQENWQAHGVVIRSIPLISSLGTGGDISASAAVTETIFRANSGDPVLESVDRANRREGPRFLNTSIFMRGDSSNIISSDYSISSASSDGSTVTYSASNSFSEGDKVTIVGSSNDLFNTVESTIVGASANAFSISKNISSSTTSSGGTAWQTGSWSPEEVDGGFTSRHIHLNSINFNIGQNSPDDELVFAFSLVDRDAVGNGDPEYIKILIEFFRNEIDQEIGYAKAEIYLDGASLTNDRYQAFRFPISDLITSPDFTASQIRVARVFSYVAVDDGSGGTEGSNEHFIALDGLRIDNISTENPLYKMVGYSSTKTSDGYPVIKFNNANNYVEFRFGIGVS